MRQEFTDRQKAQIYVRDRALCAFSGKSLWILDYGLSPTFDSDWVDHIKPAAKGGGNSIDNGICASYFYNSKKRANSHDNKHLFFAGKPTREFFYFYETVSIEIAEHLRRFANVSLSDWYFNRAAYRFMIALYRLRMQSFGKTYARTESYYAKAAMKMLKAWKKLIKIEGTFEQRGLMNSPISTDQEQLRQLQYCQAEADVLEHLDQCFPFYENSCNAIDELSTATNNDLLKSVRDKYSENEFMSQRVRDLIEINVHRLQGLYDE
ncbi:HNH endonuclease [Leptolyngbya iicbica]|uniref:HNH endonuclease n=2 Tax=Cyanophyceae TaxID=3028117 RepID=A0A4Q7E0X9_9CYAN|nr:HNH endonuclease signature motif containing protein [Leptolyngbya sp. LK]RZM75018.1 HNH endonuclease [Leptolyngbya sp. LK]